MKKDSNLIDKILFAGLAVLLIVYFTFNRGDVKRYEWKETYRANSNQPYGTLFIQKLLASQRPGQSFKVNEKEPLHLVLDSSKVKSKTDYVLVGQGIYLEKADKDALLKFVADGHDAFIASVELPSDFLESMVVSECGQPVALAGEAMGSATMEFYNGALRSHDGNGYTFAYRYGKLDLPYFWNTVTSGVFCDSTKLLTPLGFVKPDKVNFFRLSYGRGHVYVHTNPLVFTNYFMTSSDKAEYASSVFSHLNGQSIIWDEFSKAPFANQNNAPQISPMAYVLQQDSLRYAWWLMLAAAMLYLLFTARRKQRVIPVLEEKKNTSLEFVNMLAALHFQNGNHRDIAKRKMKYFFYFVRAKYGIHIQALNEGLLRRLGEKSKVDPLTLELIARQFDNVEKRTYYEDSLLVELHNALENFYKLCK